MYSRFPFQCICHSLILDTRKTYSQIFHWRVAQIWQEQVQLQEQCVISDGIEHCSRRGRLRDRVLFRVEYSDFQIRTPPKGPLRTALKSDRLRSNLPRDNYDRAETCDATRGESLQICTLIPLWHGNDQIGPRHTRVPCHRGRRHMFLNLTSNFSRVIRT